MKNNGVRILAPSLSENADSALNGGCSNVMDIDFLNINFNMKYETSPPNKVGKNINLIYSKKSMSLATPTIIFVGLPINKNIDQIFAAKN